MYLLHVLCPHTAICVSAYYYVLTKGCRVSAAIRQHMSAYVSICQHTRQHTSAYVSIRVSILPAGEGMSRKKKKKKADALLLHVSAYVSACCYVSAYVSAYYDPRAKG